MSHSVNVTPPEDLTASSLQQQRDILRQRIVDARRAGVVRELVQVDYMLYEASKKAVAILDAAIAAKATAPDLSTAHSAIVAQLDAAPTVGPRAPIAPPLKPPLPLGAAPPSAPRLPAPRKAPPKMPRVPTGPDAIDELIPW